MIGWEDKDCMQDLNTFYNWMIDCSGISESTAKHYKSGLSACFRDFIEWKLVDKLLYEMSISELDVAISKAFLCSNFIEKDTRGKRMYSNSLKQYRNFLSSNDAVLMDKNYMQFVGKNVSQTVREAVVNARIGQGIFRENIIKKYNGICIVAGINDKRLLVASHVRPWSVSTNEQRVSAENGLLLSPLYDKLFDIGLITFDEVGQIICSKELENKNIDTMKIDKKKKYNLKISPELVENLRYHQEFIFLQ